MTPATLECVDRTRETTNAPLELDAAGELFLGKRPPRQTWLRWRKDGVRGCRLRLVRSGGRWMVLPSDIRRWLAELNGDGSENQ